MGRHAPLNPNTTGPKRNGQDSPAQISPAGLVWIAPDTPLDALYLHLPFCFHKCHYCDFYSVVEAVSALDDGQRDFTDALIAEITCRSKQAPPSHAGLKTLFAGGGTPTYLRPALWQRLLRALTDTGWLGPGTAEFTVEANPETVTLELMQRLVAGGVNRVSIGAQSFDRDALKALERWHDPDSVPRAVRACRNAGITNLSLDLIFAIPGQTLEMLDRDLDALLALEPTHLSTYGLTYEPNTPLTAKLRVGQVQRAEEDLERQMYELVLTKLEAAGFEHYEISNWAKAGPTDHRCQHNLAYWHNRDWLGVGPSAASHVQGHRWRNAPNLTRYIQDAPTPPIIDHEVLPPPARFGELLMLGLRLREGIDHDWFSHHPQCKPYQRETAQELTDLGLLGVTDGRLQLTRKGLFVGDAVIAKLM
ncbi:MAG: radical SAM family heme chaperone HemW [Planctomycetota bacterium]